MSSDFLTGLANQLGDQFGLGENDNRSLDISADGTSQRYGKLGDFAKKFDQSQQRAYLQEGYLRYDQYNASPKQLEILFQEPDLTVLVKKRAFSSLADSYQLDHMNKEEKLFYKTTKILFANKCRQIAAFERLSKIERVSAATGSLSSQLVPVVLSLVDEANSSFNDFIPPEDTVDSGSDPTGGGLSKLTSIINKVKNVYSFSASNFYTTWLTNTANIFRSQYGQGTGVIEFCNVSDVSTTTTTNFEGGSFNFNINDPYNLMVITTYDIERALADATNQVYNNKIVQFGQDSVQQQIATNTKRLNDLRAQRGASPIQFLTNPDTVVSKRVRAIFTGPGEEVHFTYDAAGGLAGISPGLGGVTISEESFRGGPDVKNDGLDNRSVKSLNGVRRISPVSEAGLFSDVICSIFNQLQIQRNGVSNTKQNSAITNYARRKLRLHYAGKLCVQPMDQVHIYMGSKTRLDNKILGGLQNMFTGLGFLQNLNNTGADFRNQFDSLFNPSGNANFQMEKEIFGGPEFPNWLWTIMRSVFVNETSGAHTFGGVVTGSDSSYRNGSYSAAIAGSDMTYYLQQGRVNFKPANDVFNGPIYDPLTPFKTSFDTVSNNFKANQFELLDENKEILASNTIRFKQGPNAGKIATDKNHSNSDNEHQNLGPSKQVFYSPDGLVYKWKEGIGTFTHLSNSFIIDGDSTVGTPALTKDPFAGQDVMNAISLSITGQPYNYANFYKAAREIDSFGRDPQTGQDSAFSYYKSLTRDLVKNNVLWGNFIPFKNLTMDDATYQKMLTSQISVLNTNDKVNQQLKDIQVLTSQLQFVIRSNKSDPATNEIKTALQSKLHDQQLLLQTQLESIQNQLQGNDGPQGLNILGNDVSFDADEFLNTASAPTQTLTSPQIRRQLRRKINFLTRRLSWQVRSNEDKNLFIVDDSYDKDYDIQAFEKALADANSMKLFDSEFSSVVEKIKAAAQLLNLEVFCDPQGHIRCRPPQYNRMPSSVFYRLFQLKKSTGSQLFPQFLEDLFVSQLQSLQNNLEIIEDQIRLAGALIGASTDGALYNIIRGLSGGSQSTLTLGTDTFSFLTTESNGSLNNFDQLYQEANPEVKINIIDNTLEGQLGTQAEIQQTFGAIQRSQFIINAVVNPLLANSQFADPSFNGQEVTTQIAQTRLNKIKNRLEIKTGQQVNIDNYEINDFTASDAAGIANGSNKAKVPDIFKISNEIANNIGERQKIIKQLYKALNNAKESIALDSVDGQQTANELLAPDLSQNTSVPEIFENMIEDETYDDLGPNSGKRFVIEDYQILSFTIREAQPPYVMVEVKGQFDLFVPNDSLPNDLGNLPGGGNSLVSAVAVDYDLWRMYGFINSSSISAPFLSKPESQCAPYAATVLSRARQDILRGNLTITGNEYMQPGDVIYLKARDLLFYVSSVSHSFTYGGSFQTTLELRYGHTAGEYVPTVQDVIGKLLYNNRDATSYINRRQGSSFNEQNVGVFALNKIGGTSDVETLLFNGPQGQQNAKVLNDILYTTYFAISSNKDPNSVIKPSIELRLFYDSSQGGIDSTALGIAQDVKKMLTGHYEFQGKSPITLNSKALSDEDIIDPTKSAVDLSGKTEFRSPSQKAVDMVRNINASTSTASGAPDTTAQITSTLFGYIIDVWISFKNNSTGDQ